MKLNKGFVNLFESSSATMSDDSHGAWWWYCELGSFTVHFRPRGQGYVQQ